MPTVSQRVVKWFGWALVSLLGILLVAILIFALTFDANSYKPEIIEIVRRQLGRELEIRGDLRLSFFPPFTLQSGHAVLYEKDRHERFASMEKLHLRVALIPLFSKKLQIYSVNIDGMSVEIIRDAQGRFNIDDLIVILTPRGPSNLPVFFVDNVSVKRAQIRFRDLASASETIFTDLNGNLAPFAPAIPGRLKLNGKLKPNAATRVIPFDVQTQFTLKSPDTALLLEALHATWSMETKAGTLKSVLKVQSVAVRESISVGAAKLDFDFLGPDTASAKGTLNVAGLEWKQGNETAAPVTLTWSHSAGTWKGEGNLEGTIKTGANLPAQFSSLRGTAKISGGEVSANMTVEGMGSYDAGSKNALVKISEFSIGIAQDGHSFADVRGTLLTKLDLARGQAETKFDGKLNGGASSALFLSSLTAPEKTRFKVNLATLDLDRMRRGAPSSVKPGKQIDLDLAPLRDIGLTGELVIGQLMYGGITAKNVRVQVE